MLFGQRDPGFVGIEDARVGDKLDAALLDVGCLFWASHRGDDLGRINLVGEPRALTMRVRSQTILIWGAHAKRGGGVEATHLQGGHPR
jgi:hypothetical protein